jgi:hypothetical protein
MKKKNPDLIEEDPTPMSRAFDLLADLPEDMFAEGRKDDPPYRLPKQTLKGRPRP